MKTMQGNTRQSGYPGWRCQPLRFFKIKIANSWEVIKGVFSSNNLRRLRKQGKKKPGKAADAGKLASVSYPLSKTVSNGSKLRNS